MFKNSVLLMARVLDQLASLALIMMLIVICANVASRSLFNRPIPGALEVSILLMPIVVFGSMAWVFAREGHFAMTSLIDAKGGLFKATGLFLQILIGSLVFALLSFETVELFKRSLMRSEFFSGPINIPVYYSRFFIAIGSIITTAAILFVLLPESIKILRQKLGKDIQNDR